MQTNPEKAQRTRRLLADAITLLRANKLDDAEVSCRGALSIDPDSTGALSVLGSILLTGERHTAAAEIFDELSRRQPGEPTHWLNLGTARRGMGRYDDALAAYTRAASLGYLTADFHFNVGLTHLDRRDYE